LAAMQMGREGPNGKTFAVKVLQDFLNEHGNTYQVKEPWHISFDDVERVCRP